jgi:hypothetical protein
MLEFLLTFIVFGVYSWARYDRPKKTASLLTPEKHNGNGNDPVSDSPLKSKSPSQINNPKEKNGVLKDLEKNNITSSVKLPVKNILIAKTSPVTLTSAGDLCIEEQSVSPQPISVPSAQRLEAKAARDRLVAEKISEIPARSSSVVVTPQTPPLEQKGNGYKNGNGHHTNGNGNGNNSPSTNGVKNKPGSILPEDANIEADLNIPVEEPATTTVETTKFDKTIINQALEDSRIAIGAKIHEFIGAKKEIPGSYEPLYDLLLDYPFRGGKMLRPTMCISTARAVGGMAQRQFPQPPLWNCIIMRF